MAVFADYFNRADAYLNGGQWVASPSSAFKVVNQALEIMTTSTTGIAAFGDPDSTLETTNHAAYATIDTLPAGSWSLLVRADEGYKNYYGLRRVGATSGLALYKVVNGGTLKTIATNPYTVVQGDIVQVRAQNNKISAFINNTLLFYVLDDSIASGVKTGIRLHGNSIGTRFDSYVSSDLIIADPTAPTPPNNPLLYRGAGNPYPVGTFHFQWEPGTDDVRVAGYEISRGKSDYTVVGTTTGLFYDVTGLTPGTTDSWHLRSFDDDGNFSAYITWADKTVPEGTSTTPTPTPTPTANADNFNRTDGALGSPWNVYPSAAVKVVDNAAEFTTTGVGVQAIYGRGTSGVAQFARVQISNVSGTIAVLAAGSPDTSAPGVLTNYYGFRRVGPSTVSIIRGLGGASPVTLASISAVVSVGDTIEIQVNAAGNEVSGWVNGTKVLSVATTISYTNYNYVGVRSTTNAQGFRFDEFITGVPAGSSNPAPADVTPPSTPTLSVSGIGQTTATLTSSAATDASGVASYRFYKGTSILATQTSRTYSVSGLAANTTYSDFAVSAIDNAGNISQKSTVVFKTLAATTTPTPTPTPTGFQWAGKSFNARGDSSGNVQGTTGTDFDNAHTWPYLVANGWADTANPSVPDPTPYPSGLNLAAPSIKFVKNHTDNATAQDVFVRMLNGSTRWVPGSYDIVSIFVGGNDVGYFHDFAAGEASYRNSLSAILGLLRANSSPVQTGTTTGTWSTPAVTGSGKAKVSTNPGDTFTYTFSGSNATFLALAATSGAGSNFTYQLDGGAVVSKTTKAQSMIRTRMLNSNVAPVPVHFRNLSSGQHTLKITHTGSAGDPLVVDSVLPWLTSEADMPFVLMVPPGLFSTSTTGGAAGYPDPDPNNEDVYRFRSILDSVLEEFGFANNVGVVDAALLDEKFPPTALNIRIKDGLHPNLQGNKVIADVILESLAKYPTN